MQAKQLQQMGEKIIGWRILTQPMGDYRGGPAEILDRGDDPGAPEIVLNVRNDTGEPMGIFENEDVKILQKTELRKFEPETCNGCHYLGHAYGHDLYYHYNHHETTLIARYGKNGDYCSGLVFSYSIVGLDGPTNKAMRECLLRALGVQAFRSRIIEHVVKWERDFPERRAKFMEIFNRVPVTQ